MNNKYIKPYINKEDGNTNRESEDVHHILARSRGGSNEYENKVSLYRSYHEALHRLFGTGTPREQMLQLLFINGKALSEDFKNDIIEILKETDDQYYYKDGVLLPKK